MLLHSMNKQNKNTFLYQGYANSDSLIEFDEEPVSEIEQTALRVSLVATKIFQAFIPERIIVMRKTVIDGSNTSGFQRTALVGMDGVLSIGGKEITIDTICLEEDAAKLVERTPTHDTYNLSRLGIPLLEVATGPDITSPEQLKEVAQQIGLMLRNVSLDGVNRVKRGIGTIRQDVNVSIEGGARVEIKGAQELRLLPKLARCEAQRQQALLLLKKAYGKKKLVVETSKDITTLFSKTTSVLVKNALSKKQKLIALRIKNGKGLCGTVLLPKRRFGTELADYVKISAGLSGIIHSDELPAYGVTQKEKDAIAKTLHCAVDDGFLFVIGDVTRATLALQTVKQRIEQALQGVPSEVRKALPDGTTSYLRPMPGNARLYPETDMLPIIPPSVTVSDISHVTASHESIGLNKDLSHSLLRQQKMLLFKELSNIAVKVKPSFIAEILVTYPKELKAKKANPENVTEEQLRAVFVALNKGQITKQSLFPLLIEVSNTGKLALNKFSVLSDDALKKELKKICMQHKDLPLNALIGKTMAVLKGKAEPEKILKLLKHEQKEL